MDTATLHEDLMAAKALYGENLWLAVELFNELDDDLWLVTLMQAGEDIGVPLVAVAAILLSLGLKLLLEKAGFRWLYKFPFALTPGPAKTLS